MITVDALASSLPGDRYRRMLDDDPSVREVASMVTRATSRQLVVEIVQWGLSDVLVWTGELAPTEAACRCITGTQADVWSPAAHTVGDHKHDCNYYEPCGGCAGCLARQAAYYGEGR